MKKLILSAALATGLFFNASAQAPRTTTNTNQTTSNTSSDTGGIKPTGGDITLEANVNLLNGNVNLSNSLNQIRGRYFFADDMALRLGVNISYRNDDPELNVKANTFEFSIAPGIEKHFAGTNRLSPYVGADLLFGLKNSHYEDSNSHGHVIKTELDGSWKDGAQRGYFLIGLAGVAGFDFYVAKHLYFGYELGLELSSTKLKEVKTTTTYDNIATTTSISPDRNTFNFGPNIRNGIRLGFVF